MLIFNTLTIFSGLFVAVNSAPQFFSFLQATTVPPPPPRPVTYAPFQNPNPFQAMQMAWNGGGEAQGQYNQQFNTPLGPLQSNTQGRILGQGMGYHQMEVVPGQYGRQTNMQGYNQGAMQGQVQNQVLLNGQPIRSYNAAGQMQGGFGYQATYTRPTQAPPSLFGR